MDSPEHKKSYVGTTVTGIYDVVTGHKSDENPIMRSPFLSTMLTGITFGITTGGLQELHRQGQTGEFDLGQAGKRAALQGALDTLAAIPGGLQARAYHKAAIENLQREQRPRRIELREDQAQATLRPVENVRSIPVNFELVATASSPCKN